ncbi:hypothetical protein [Thiofilum flexile]|uniref:hypothetical protein n=1 Tax=Thiofilum flexile TaxID=125627 RepID=UPI00036DE0E5|nr:hypothetical protein [Thiofilum flexile]
MLILKKTLKWLMRLVLVLTLGLVLFLIACKIAVDYSPIISHKIFNPAKTCYLNIYKITTADKPLRSFDGFASGLIQLTRGSIVYRIYTQDHKLIATTEWRLFDQLTMLEAPHWIGNATLLYDGRHGYEQFLLPDCGIKK